MYKRQHQILFLRPEELEPRQRRHVDDYFDKVLFPVLTPLAVDTSRPFPLLANKSLNIAVRLQNKDESMFAVVQVPSILKLSLIHILPGWSALSIREMADILSSRALCLTILQGF